jgi:Taurine catabolism dioxygenase TauD, TfdA family
MRPIRTPVAASSAWRSRDLADRRAYTVDLSDAHLAAFDAALASRRAAGRAIEDTGAGDFALGAIAGDLAGWRDEVLHGRGFVVLRGLTADRYSPEDQAPIFWGLGAHFGRAVSQSAMGDRIGHVIDVGGQDRRERAYRNSRELSMHTDRCDVIGMLCLVKARSGGVSGYTSAHAIHNEILASRPALLEPLFRGFRYHRRGEELPGEPPITAERVPVLSECAGELSVVFLRAYMEMAAKELGEPLDAEEVAALDYFEEVAARPDLRLEFTLEPGEAIFFNNCTMLHNRTAFEDDPDPARKRHLLRLWLMLDGQRPLAPVVHAYKGTRGIEGQDGRSTYYTGAALPVRY